MFFVFVCLLLFFFFCCCCCWFVCVCVFLLVEYWNENVPETFLETVETSSIFGLREKIRSVTTGPNFKFFEPESRMRF